MDLEVAAAASRYPHVRWIAAAATTGLRQPSSISSCPSSSLFHTRIDAWPQQWENARAMTARRGVSTPMRSAHYAMSYVLCIGLERTRWILTILLVSSLSFHTPRALSASIAWQSLLLTLTSIDGHLHSTLISRVDVRLSPFFLLHTTSTIIFYSTYSAMSMACAHVLREG